MLLFCLAASTSYYTDGLKSFRLQPGLLQNESRSACSPQNPWAERWYLGDSHGTVAWYLLIWRWRNTDGGAQSVCGIFRPLHVAATSNQELSVEQSSFIHCGAQFAEGAGRPLNSKGKRYPDVFWHWGLDWFLRQWSKEKSFGYCSDCVLSDSGAVANNIMWVVGCLRQWYWNPAFGPLNAVWRQVQLGLLRATWLLMMILHYRPEIPAIYLRSNSEIDPVARKFLKFNMPKPKQSLGVS